MLLLIIIYFLVPMVYFYLNTSNVTVNQEYGYSNVFRVTFKYI